MSIGITTPLALVFALLTAILGAYLAQKRGRNPYTWFLLSFFLLGILALFIVIYVPVRKKTLQKKLMTATPAQELPRKIQGPSDKFWYYLNLEHQQVGPMSLDALTTAWRQGKISLNTFVWNEELPDWKLLQDLLKITS